MTCIPLMHVHVHVFVCIMFSEDYLPSTKVDGSSRVRHQGFVQMWDEIDTQIQVGCHLFLILCAQKFTLFCFKGINYYKLNSIVFA